MGDISKHFNRSEFVCKCGCGFVSVNQKLVDALEKIREHFGKPVTLNCVCRCQKHNAEVGGEVNSQHLVGNAADIKVTGVAPAVVAAYCESISPAGGVGRYKNFTHVDVRGKKARWKGAY